MSKSLPQRLDDLARLTGVPQLSEFLAKGLQLGHHFRWLPIILLLLAAANEVMLLALPAYWNLSITGLAMISAIASILPLFGPLKQWGTIDGVDERDRQLRRSAYLIALAFMSFLAVVGMFSLIALAFVNDWSREFLMIAMGGLSYFLVITFETVPTLYASWTTDALDDE